MTWTTDLGLKVLVFKRHLASTTHLNYYCIHCPHMNSRAWLHLQEWYHYSKAWDSHYGRMSSRRSTAPPSRCSCQSMPASQWGTTQPDQGSKSLNRKTQLQASSTDKAGRKLSKLIRIVSGLSKSQQILGKICWLSWHVLANKRGIWLLSSFHSNCIFFHKKELCSPTQIMQSCTTVTKRAMASRWLWSCHLRTYAPSYVGFGLGSALQCGRMWQGSISARSTVVSGGWAHWSPFIFQVIKKTDNCVIQIAQVLLKQTCSDFYDITLITEADLKTLKIQLPN